MKFIGLKIVVANLLVLAFTVTAKAEPIGISARRLPNESAAIAARRAYTVALKRGGFMDLKTGLTAQDAMRPFKEINLNSISSWPDKNFLTQNFEAVRDIRMVDMPETPKFPRRLSWLYPDDGCFARADLERKNLVERGLPPLQKIVITGDLTVKTANAPDGMVTWWWHISQIVRVGSEVYVLDPAIEPSRALPVREWLARMVPKVDEAQVAICSPFTYTISSDCNQPADQSESALSDEYYYLDYEWSRQVELGRDPNLVLGNSPPWK